MKAEIKVPTMGESVIEATVGTILKENGTAVAAEEEIIELETDKVNQVLYAPEAGVLSLTVGIDETVTATVQMRRSIPEGAGTSHVTLRSSHPAVHPAATRVRIREGEQSADITLRALGLPENNPVTITATYRGVEETMAVIVPKLKSLSLPSRVGVGETISGEVRLDYPAPSH